MRRTALATLGTTLALLAACSNAVDVGNGIAAMVLTYPPFPSVVVGGQVTITARAVTTAGDTVPLAPAWRVADTTIVSITSGGVVTGRAAGITSVQAIAGTLVSNPISISVTAPSGP